MYDFPGSDGPHEWIEIWNTGDVAQDLTAWKFFDGTNHALNAPPANDGQGSLILNPETYAIFADSAATFLTDHPGFSGIVIDTVMSLNNTGATLKLLDTNGMVVSQLTYANSNGARGNGKTLEVKVDGSLAPSNTIGGTRGAQNSPLSTSTSPPPPPPTPPPSTLHIALSELLPNPVGADLDGEFVELYNAGSTMADISSWQIKDASGSTKTFPSGTVLAQGEYRAFYKTVNLNNNAETITLLDGSASVRDTIQWNETAKEGLAFAKTTDSWAWTTTPTPNASNMITTPASENDNGSTATLQEPNDAPQKEAAYTQTQDMGPLSNNMLFLGIAAGFAALGGIAFFLIRRSFFSGTGV